VQTEDTEKLRLWPHNLRSMRLWMVLDLWQRLLFASLWRHGQITYSDCSSRKRSYYLLTFLGRCICKKRLVTVRSYFIWILTIPNFYSCFRFTNCHLFDYNSWKSVFVWVWWFSGTKNKRMSCFLVAFRDQYCNVYFHYIHHHHWNLITTNNYSSITL